MNNFDKIKISTRLKYVSDVDVERFIVNIKNGKKLFYKYEQNQPFYLLLLLNFERNEFIIEFTGKILLDKYTSLINEDTIEDCLKRINDLKICNIDIPSILVDGEVLKLDVTHDSDTKKWSLNNIIDSIRHNIGNYRKWVVKSYMHTGVVIENVVKTKRYYKRLIIYDKSYELNLANNCNFLNSISNRNEVLSYFMNKVRFELNINSKSMIRRLLGITDNDIQSVLHSTVNPILVVLDEILGINKCSPLNINLRNYERGLLLKDCNYDMVAVEAKVRSYLSSRTSIRRAMLPYWQLYLNMKENDQITTDDIRRLVI